MNPLIMALLGTAIEQIANRSKASAARKDVGKQYWKQRAESYGRDMSYLDLQDSYRKIDAMENQGMSSGALNLISGAIGAGSSLGGGGVDPDEARAWAASYRPPVYDQIDRTDMRLNENDFPLLGGSNTQGPFIPKQQDSQGGYSLEEEDFPLLSGKRKGHRFRL